MRVPKPTRVALGLLGLVLGVMAGVLGSFVHALTWAGLPVGLLLGLGLSLAVFATAGLAGRSRGGAALAAAGWVVAVLALSSRRPEGDLVVPAGALGNGWLVGGLLLAGLAVAWPYGGLPRYGVPTSAEVPSPSGASRDGR